MAKFKYKRWTNLVDHLRLKGRKDNFHPGIGFISHT